MEKQQRKSWEKRKLNIRKGKKNREKDKEKKKKL